MLARGARTGAKNAKDLHIFFEHSALAMQMAFS
jgi:hypothetical protein